MYLRDFKKLIIIKIKERERWMKKGLKWINKS